MSSFYCFSKRRLGYKHKLDEWSIFAMISNLSLPFSSMHVRKEEDLVLCHACHATHKHTCLASVATHEHSPLPPPLPPIRHSERREGERESFVKRLIMQTTSSSSSCGQKGKARKMEYCGMHGHIRYVRREKNLCNNEKRNNMFYDILLP